MTFCDVFLFAFATMRLTLRARMVDLGGLNPQQREAVQTINGPVLILAGAGTGKTRVITCRIAHMIHRGIPPGNILGVTFTNKAAREMLERVNQLLPSSRRTSSAEVSSGKNERPTLSTFHSLCVKILRQYIDRLGYKRNFVIYDESDQLGAIRKILSRISVQGEKADPIEVLALLSRYRNAKAGADSFGNANVDALAQHVRKHYESALRACNAVDFDDLILLALKLFREHPDVLEACRHRFRYVMVDEYQDTNAAQFELVHALTREHRNFCVVGDDDQSIYGWRGAEIANLLELEKYYPEVKIIKLEQNYRSTNTILTAANAVIKNNARRRLKKLWSSHGQGEKILLTIHENEEEEGRAVADAIECDRMVRRIPWRDQAVLFRTNIQARPLETALRQAGIRYRLVGGQSFFDRREIKDFLAYLKVVFNPHDDVSLLRIANVPARGLSEVTMERLLAASQERKSSVYTAMRHTDVQERFAARTQESIREFLELLEENHALLEREGAVDLALWAERLLAGIDYYTELRRGEKNPETAENRVRNLKDLVATMNRVPPAHHPLERLETFLEELALDRDRETDQENDSDAVTLITMHSCKGLEFPHVQIVGIEDGLLPHTRSKSEGTLDEERRLFYVAITRARKTLKLSCCTGRKKYGQLSPCHPSPFLQELPADLVESSEEQGRRPVQSDQGKSLFDSMRAAIGDS
jgi:superfamily I DNA/RNA helicase